jgi:hypothetical protein
MKFFQRLFSVGYIFITVFFFLCGVLSMAFAAIEIWHAVNPLTSVSMQHRFVMVLESIALLTISVAALELGQTVLEEEVQRTSSISAPTRVRRFLSRFLIVVIVSLSIECLVAVFQFIHKTPELLPQAASVGIAAAILLAAWGVFVNLNIGAEKLEPQAMQEAKAEDKKVET